MPITLFEHNAEAYTAALAMLNDTGKAAIIHPTGTGKSFIGFKLCEDNPEKLVCWISPSEYIFKTQLENLAEVSGGYVPENVVFYTYAKLMNMSGTEINEINPDYIILDEFHRAGAEFWGAGVHNLLKAYPNVPILGLTATNVRYLDNQRDMAVELFNGNIASEMTLGEAIVRGILPAPKYVLSVFPYKKQLEKYESRVQKAKSKAVRDEGEKYLEALRRALEKADGLDEIFAKHIENKSGKYIVFCANYEHLCEMTERAKDWFSKIDREPHIYTAYSDDPETSREFSEFKKDNSEHLKLLFCIDMLNEGIHVDDVCGVILLRPTVSPIIYKQQIGRALSASKKSNPIIFDIVLNIENLYSVGTIEEEMQIATSYYRSLGLDNEIVTEHFKVIDEVRDCIDLFDKLNDTLVASWDLMYEKARQYYLDNGDLEVQKRYITSDGYALGSWINTQRLVREGKCSGSLTEDKIKKLDSIGMRWENFRDIAWEKNYAAAKAYYEKNGDLLVNISDNRFLGVSLGQWISQLRNYRKNNIQCSYLTPERIKKLDDIGMVWNVPDYLFEKKYSLCLEYYKNNGNLDIPSNYIAADGTKLGAWVHSLRYSSKNKSSKRAELTESQKKRLEELGFDWNGKHLVSWERSYESACEYKRKNGIESNLVGFYNILEACRATMNTDHPVEHLVYASSSSVYGTNKKVPYSTDDKVDNPVSLYAATKKSNELMAHAYSKLYNIPSTSLRFFTVYGPAGRPDMAYFGFTNRLLKGQTIEIFNYGNCKRDFTYVDDIVTGVKHVMQNAPEKVNGEDGLPLPPYRVYNIGNNNPENLLDFVQILSEELVRAEVLPADYDFEAHKKLVPMQPGDVPVTYADTSALERDFGFKPSTSLRDGLRKFAEWYKEFYKV